MDRKIIIAGSIFGMTAIILGAFGAHALKAVLDSQQLASFETGVKYQMYHALLLLFIGIELRISDKTKRRMFYLIIFGTLFFSGSIYLLVTRNLTQIDFRQFAFVTPIGGLLLIIAWILLFVEFLRKKS